ncbi:hypothetical protein BOTBODRAFT_55295 [Botryobasidium botryosum FD-172 SS1]|uniref:Uncharacterized protein n=1 Tax=Botryobasidium botryosum (strain FD-172 SS1) TaxID=930990 RepID=A0A067MF83_BOTB1|nr:hypothetical protein BOTBODRAFT_55295 [Botryobasidium botryosum FD-172 SS1]
MEAIAAIFVPLMIQKLSESVCQSWQQEDMKHAFASRSTSNPQFYDGRPAGPGQVREITTSGQCEAITVARDFAIKAILSHTDRLLADVRKSNVLFKKRHNPLPPAHINSLPNEILGLIFVFAANHPKAISQTPVRISHVSTLWRQISLSTPRLWQRVDGFMNENLVRAYVSRSGTAPLSMELGDPTAIDLVATRHGTLSTLTALHPPPKERLATLLRASIHHAPRWHSLVLHCPDTGPEILDQCRDLQSPQLHTLRAHFKSPGLYNSFIFSTGVFGNHTPSLRDLHLDGVSVPLTCAIYAGLTSLVLANTFHPDAQPRDLLQVIAACPLLETLGIHSMWLGMLTNEPDSSADIKQASTPLSALCLQSLTMTDLCNEWIQYVLSSIRCAHFLRLRVCVGGTDLGDILPPVESLGECLPNISTTHSLELEFPPCDSDVHICCSTTGGGTFHFTTGYEDTDLLVSRVISSMDRLGHLPNLESLSIKGGEGYGPDVENVPAALFSGVLERFSLITSLSLTSCPAHFIEMFTITKTSHLLPRLESITLEGGKFGGKALAALAKSRTHLGPPASPSHRWGTYLREVRIRGFEKISPKTRAALEELPLSVDIELDEYGDCLTWIRKDLA